jgi:hypothetical protein
MRIFEPMKEKWQEERLHNDELHNLCYSPNIIREIKFGSGIDKTCSTHGRNAKCNTKFLSENLNVKYHAADRGVDGKANES